MTISDCVIVASLKRLLETCIFVYTFEQPLPHLCFVLWALLKVRLGTRDCVFLIVSSIFCNTAYREILFGGCAQNPAALTHPLVYPSRNWAYLYFDSHFQNIPSICFVFFVFSCIALNYDFSLLISQVVGASCCTHATS